MEYSRPQIMLKAIVKSFTDGRGGAKVVLNNLSWELREAKFVGLVGPNGCGKTSFLNLIAGIISPDAGSVDVLSRNGSRARVGYVWQNYRASLLPWFDVAENIALPLRSRGIGRKKRRHMVESVLEEFLPGVRATDRCYTLSGGEQQLLSVLRSTTIEPDIMLLDEPFSALDQQRSWRMALHLERIWRDRPIPTVFVSHDVDEAVLLSDTIVVMSSTGRIDGSITNELPRPRSIHMLTSPEHLRCRNAVISILNRHQPNGL